MNKQEDWDKKELNTESHDRIMLQLMGEEKWISIITLYEIIPEIILQEHSIDGFKLLDYRIEKLEIHPEHPVQKQDSYKDTSYLFGFIDFLVVVGYSYSYSYSGQQLNGTTRTAIFCEIKTSEPSFGNVIRQINKYKFYGCRGNWIVISPYSEWDAPLKAQEILWIPSSIIEVL